jgi:hypothetical protein
MNKSIAIFIAVLLTIVVLVVLAGCTIQKSPEGGFKVGVTEQTHKTISDAGDGATETLGLLSMFFPALAPFAAAAGVGTLTWKKMKNTVTQYKDPLEMYVAVLEGIKQNDAATWKKVKAEIKAKNPDLAIEGTILELKDELARLLVSVYD